MKVPGVDEGRQDPRTPCPRSSPRWVASRSIANSTWAAIKGRKALKRWDDGPNKDYDSDALQGKMAERRASRARRAQWGDVDKALAGADKVIEHEYYIPHLVHAPMEPPAATCRSTAMARPRSGLRAKPGRHAWRSCRKLGLKEDDVTVNVTLLGGGFGRKSKCDFALEAAHPVQGDGRHAGEGGVDSRRRHPALLLSRVSYQHDHRRHSTATRRCGLAPSQRLAVADVQLHAGSDA